MLPLIMFLVTTGQCVSAFGKTAKCCQPGDDGKVLLPNPKYRAGDGPFCGTLDKSIAAQKYPHSVCPIHYHEFIQSEELFIRSLNKPVSTAVPVYNARAKVKKIFTEFGKKSVLKRECPKGNNPQTHIPYAMLGVSHSESQLVAPSEQPIVDAMFRSLDQIGSENNKKILVFLELTLDIDRIEEPAKSAWATLFRQKYKHLIFESTETETQSRSLIETQKSFLNPAGNVPAKDFGIHDKLFYYRNIYVMKKMTEIVNRYSSQIIGVVSIHGSLHLNYFGANYDSLKFGRFSEITNTYHEGLNPQLDFDDIKDQYDTFNEDFASQRCFDHYILPNCSSTARIHPVCQSMHTKTQQKRDWTTSQKKSQLPPEKLCSQKQPHSKCGR